MVWAFWRTAVRGSAHCLAARGWAGSFNAQLCAKAPTALKKPKDGLGVFMHSCARERPLPCCQRMGLGLLTHGGARERPLPRCQRMGLGLLTHGGAPERPLSGCQGMAWAFWRTAVRESAHRLDAKGSSGRYDARRCAGAPTVRMPRDGLGVLAHSCARERPPSRCQRIVWAFYDAPHNCAPKRPPYRSPEEGLAACRYQRCELIPRIRRHASTARADWIDNPSVRSRPTWRR